MDIETKAVEAWRAYCDEDGLVYQEPSCFTVHKEVDEEVGDLGESVLLSNINGRLATYDTETGEISLPCPECEDYESSRCEFCGQPYCFACQEDSTLEHCPACAGIKENGGLSGMPRWS